MKQKYHADLQINGNADSSWKFHGTGCSHTGWIIKLGQSFHSAKCFKQRARLIILNRCKAH